jgi:hypothetical protein
MKYMPGANPSVDTINSGASSYFSERMKPDTDAFKSYV